MASATMDITALALALLPASARALSKDYRAYSFEWVPLAVSAAATPADFTVDPRNDFIGVLVTGNATDTAAPPVENATPQFTLNIKVGESDVFDKNVHWRNFVGSAIAPFPIPFPLYLPRGVKTTARLTNLTAVAGNARITIHGFHIHDYPRTQSRGF
jgi:hypothetical protein